MAPANTLRISGDDYEEYDSYAPLSKAEKFAFARARIEADLTISAIAANVEKLGLEVNEIANVAALYTGSKTQRLYIVTSPEGKKAAAVAHRLWHLRVIASAVFAVSIVALVHSIFLAGYNFHQKDPYGLLMWGVVCFAAIFATTAAYAVLQRVRVARGDSYSAAPVAYYVGKSSPSVG